YDSAVLTASGPVAAGWISVDVKSYVAGDGDYSFALVGTSSTLLSFASKEAGAATAPQLVVQTDGGSGEDPVVVAAGDIACDTTDSSYNNGLGTSYACRERATSDLFAPAPPAAVLTLGDNQYDVGDYAKYLASFDPSWGRAKSLIHPAPGNH